MNQSALEGVNGVLSPIFQFQNIHESSLVFQSYYWCTKGMNFTQYSYGTYMPCPFSIRTNISSPWKEFKNPQLTWGTLGRGFSNIMVQLALVLFHPNFFRVVKIFF
jgi:hypothetical protein